MLLRKLCQNKTEHAGSFVCRVDQSNKSILFDTCGPNFKVKSETLKNDLFLSLRSSIVQPTGDGKTFPEFIPPELKSSGNLFPY